MRKQNLSENKVLTKGEFSTLMVLRETQRELKIPESFISQVIHAVTLSITKKPASLEKGMFIISVDVDVGSGGLGILNHGRNDRNVHNYLSERIVGEAEKTALPIFLDAFEEFQVPVTFALRGQMLEVDSSPLVLLLNSEVKHDIGGHGYSHKRFSELSSLEAEVELSKLATAMDTFKIKPSSFVFPKNSVAHLDLLEKHGYRSYRSYGNFKLDCMQIEKHGNLFNLRPSLNVDQSINSLLLKQIVRVAIRKHLPLHMWFHLWNFGLSEKALRKSVQRIFLPLLKFARKEVDGGLLTFETMASAIDKIGNSSIEQTIFKSGSYVGGN